MPKPTALKVLEGNPGKRPLNDHEPIPPKGELKCPSWLLPEAKKEWKRLASSLEAMGVPVTAESFADQYLPKAPVGSGVSPEEAYIGEPTSYNDGYYCLPPALALGINRFLDTQNTSLTAKTHRLTPFSEIALRLHLEKKPVIVWLTSDDKLAQRSETVVWQVAGREYHPYTNLHAVVVDGISGFKVHLVDSINGARWMPLTKFLPIYYSMGLRAVYFTD